MTKQARDEKQNRWKRNSKDDKKTEGMQIETKKMWVKNQRMKNKKIER
jgi:hypothetical protein